MNYEEKMAEYPAKLAAFEEKKARGERATKPALPANRR
jgi:hypothetical protein